jgi:hypothetical protein
MAASRIIALVRNPPAVRRSAGTEDEQDEGKQGKGDLDVIAVDLGCKREYLVFHLTPLSIGISLNVTVGQASKEASKKNPIIRK